MEAFKNLIKNIALFLLIGAIPSIGWASGWFTAFSWASFALLLGGCFCILWLKERQSAQNLRDILLTRDDKWALCEGDQIIASSPSFPSQSLHSLKTFFHPTIAQEVEQAVSDLIYKNLSFQLTVHAVEGNAIYSFEGIPLNGKVIFWLRNITDSIYQERHLKEQLQVQERLLCNLQATLDMLPTPIWQRDKDQRITYCNLAYSKAAGAPPQVIIKEEIELIQPRFAKILARKAVNTNESQFFDNVAIVEEKRCHFRICETPNPLTQGSLGIGFDITELNDAKKEIKNLIDAHDEVLAHLSTAISIYDVNGNLQYYNQAYVNLNNFDEEFLKTRPCLDEILEDLRSRRQLPEHTDFPAYKKKYIQRLTEQIEPQEEMIHLPDERTLRYFSAPHPMGGFLCMFEDVTNYLSLERNNKTLLNSYQTTLDNLFEGVVVIGSNNRLEIFNPSFLHLWNFNQDDVSIGQHLTLIVEKLKNFFDYEGDWETYKAQFIESVTDRIPKTGQLKRKDGVSLYFSYVPLPNGSHLLSYVDTTDTGRVQQALQERNEALETADRLKSEFIESISFELKSPLNTIISFSEVLYHQYFGSLNERQIDYVEGVLDSSTKLLHFVNDILDLASIEAGYLTLNPGIVEIPILLKNIAKIIAKRAEKNGQHIILKCDNVVNEWVADERRLKQALLNLLSNAIKFTPLNGKITLSASLIEDELVLSVMDTGPGIAVDEQVHLLDKGERGKGDKQPTSGIGLSLVKNLIELHGGRIELVSEIKKGTMVRCFLPRISLPNLGQSQQPTATIIPCQM